MNTFYVYLFDLDRFDHNLTGILVAFLFALLRIDQVKLKNHGDGADDHIVWSHLCSWH